MVSLMQSFEVQSMNLERVTYSRLISDVDASLSFKESSHQPTEVQVQEGPSNRRFLAHSPRTLSSPRSPKKRTHTSTHGGKGWPVAERVYGEESKLVQSKRGEWLFVLTYPVI